jgi:hypothetical protein
VGFGALGLSLQDFRVKVFVNSPVLVGEGNCGEFSSCSAITRLMYGNLAKILFC